MTPISRPAANPIASLARSYAITDHTPDHGELRSTPRLFSSRRDRHVNVLGHTQGSEGQQERRAVHRRLAAQEVSAAFRQTLGLRLPGMSLAQRDGLAGLLEQAVGRRMTVGVVRRLVLAEQSQLQAFGARVLRDSKNTKATEWEAFGVRVMPQEVRARESQAVRALLGLEAEPAPEPAPQAPAALAGRPQDAKAAVRHDGLDAGAALTASDFATVPVLNASHFENPSR